MACTLLMSCRQTRFVLSKESMLNGVIMRLLTCRPSRKSGVAHAPHLPRSTLARRENILPTLNRASSRNLCRAKKKADADPELEKAIAAFLAQEQEREERESVARLWEDISKPQDDFSHSPDHRSGFAAIIGLPNVGKSTLLNSLLGQKLSIVTRKAQTTRNRVFGIFSDDDHQARITSYLCQSGGSCVSPVGAVGQSRTADTDTASPA